MVDMIGPVSKCSDFVVRIRGIPWSCSKDEIVEFFNDCTVKNGTEGVHFVHAHDSGKPSGEAFIELETSTDAENAKKHTMGYIGTRYIEVFESNKDEMMFILNGGKRHEGKGKRKEGRPPPKAHSHQFQDEGFGFIANTCVRLRGLPFNSTEKDLFEFFEGFEIVPHGIKMPLDGKYRSVGEAYVKFATTADVDRALGTKNKERIGHRYIEIFRSNSREFDNCYVPGWNPPPQPQNDGNRPPWMNDNYSPPRGPPRRPPLHGPQMNPYPEYDYYPPHWGGGPPPPGHYDYNYNGYGPPGPPPYESYHWPPYPSHPPGPMRGPARHPRPYPYERPPPWATEPSRPQEGRPPPPPPPASKPLSNNFVFVRNLPPNVVEKDIDLFFRVKPTNVKIILDPYGRPEEANVAFATHEDAVTAMEQDKQMLFDKPVDLFLCSKEIPRQQKEVPEKKENEALNSNNYNYPYAAYNASTSNGSNGNENGNGNAHPITPSPSSQQSQQAPQQPLPPQQPPPPQKTAEEAAPTTSSAPDTTPKPLSYFGMPPVRWPASAAPGTAAAPSSYPAWPYYGHPNAYYGYGNPFPVPANPPASSIRRDPVNYTSR